MEPWLEAFADTIFRRCSDTAHDLKTPLNVAVLNLELLKMRLAKLAPGNDEKLTGYAAALDAELRRMARIFDAFFLLAAPPKGQGAPQRIDAGAIAAAAACSAGYTAEPPSEPALVSAHAGRIQQAMTMFFEGVSHVLKPESCRIALKVSGGELEVSAEGDPLSADLELSKIFKFYYTDALGNPDLSLAAARLIAETYRGALNASEERDKVKLRLSLPLGER